MNEALSCGDETGVGQIKNGGSPSLIDSRHQSTIMLAVPSEHRGHGFPGKGSLLTNYRRARCHSSRAGKPIKQPRRTADPKRAVAVPRRVAGADAVHSFARSILMATQLDLPNRS
jgi:hypothetical protein